MKIVGGLKGIQRLSESASVMLELAVLAERWNWEQGPVISEMIRRDATRINRAVARVRLGMLCNVGLIRAPFYIQEAASSYHLIRGRLLGLYEVSHAGLWPRLEAAV